MAEIEAIPQEIKERIEQIGAADLVIGISNAGGGEQIGTTLEVVRAAIAQPSPPRTVLVYAGDPRPEDASNGGFATDGFLRLMRCPAFGAGHLPGIPDGQSDASRALFTIGKGLGARACALLGSDMEVFTENRLLRLIQPLLEFNFDLVVPWYAKHQLDGLLNTSIIYPLTRSLYGKRIRWPAASDFGFSARMIERYLIPEPPAFAASRRGQLIWIVTAAVCEGFEVCQARVKVGLHSPKDPPDLSSALAQILGAVFIDMERTAAIWQRVRGSQPVRTFGTEPDVPEGSFAGNVQPMVESFQSGFQNLQEVWSFILPPATLLELKKLTRLAPNHFRLSDELWARIIFDFALGHRLRVMNRDHLLRAITPLYLAWVASYALEVQAASTAAVERRVEQLCVAYETQKPYLLSRWRWPDRFSS